MTRPFFFCLLPRRTLLGLLFLLFLFLVRSLVLVTSTPREVLSPIYQGPAQPKAAITINVDWGEEHIPAMLKIMEEHQIYSTFFVTGTFVQKHPELVRQIVERGHELGNHGFEHLHPNFLSREDLLSLMKENELLIEEEIGVKTVYFAPPYGEYNDEVLEVAEELGYRVIMWTVDSVDWQRPGSSVIKDRVLRGTEEGSIILIHPIQQTVEVLDPIITGIKEKGITPVTLSSLLKE